MDFQPEGTALTTGQRNVRAAGTTHPPTTLRSRGWRLFLNSTGGLSAEDPGPLSAVQLKTDMAGSAL